MSPFLFSNPKTKSKQARKISRFLDLSSRLAIVKVLRVSWSRESLLVNLKRLCGFGQRYGKIRQTKKTRPASLVLVAHSGAGALWHSHASAFNGDNAAQLQCHIARAS